MAIVVAPIASNESRTWFQGKDAITRALREFSPQPTEIFQKPFDEERKQFRLLFTTSAATDFEAEQSAESLYNALQQSLRTAGYRAVQWWGGVKEDAWGPVRVRLGR